jgi:hypothetical protein
MMNLENLKMENGCINYINFGEKYRASVKIGESERKNFMK